MQEEENSIFTTARAVFDMAMLRRMGCELDQWLRQYNEVRTHQGRWCYGKTLMQTFLDSLPMAREKLLDQQNQPVAVAC